MAGAAVEIMTDECQSGCDLALRRQRQAVDMERSLSSKAAPAAPPISTETAAAKRGPRSEGPASDEKGMRTTTATSSLGGDLREEASTTR